MEAEIGVSTFVYIDHYSRQINIGSCQPSRATKTPFALFPEQRSIRSFHLWMILCFSRGTIFEGANGALTIKIQEIWEILGTDPYELKIHLFSNQLTLNEAEKFRLQTALARHRADLYEHGLYEIAHGVVTATRPKFRKRINPVAEQFFTVTENGHRGFVTRLTLKNCIRFLNSPIATNSTTAYWIKMSATS